MIVPSRFYAATAALAFLLTPSAFAFQGRRLGDNTKKASPKPESGVAPSAALKSGKTEQSLEYDTIDLDTTYELVDLDATGYFLFEIKGSKGKEVTCLLEACDTSTGTPGEDLLVAMFDMELDSNGNITGIDYFWFGESDGCPVAMTVKATEYGAFYNFEANKTVDSSLLTCFIAKDGEVPAGACFSGETVVEVQGKGPVEMKDLQVSDKVFVGTESTGTPMYQSVYSFGHVDKETPYEYLQIHTSPSSAKPLEITAAHLLYVEGKAAPVRADSIKKGDTLIQDTVDGSKTSVKVTKIDKVTRNGAYMPLTKDGSIVVNQILASSYVSIMDDAPEIVSQYLNVVSEDQLLHWWLAPYRMVCENAPSLCENDFNDEGIAYWLVLGRYVAQVGNGIGSFGQMVGLVAFGLFMAVAMAFEAVINFFTSPIGFGVGAALFGLAKGNFAWNGIEVSKKLD